MGCEVVGWVESALFFKFINTIWENFFLIDLRTHMISNNLHADQFLIHKKKLIWYYVNFTA